MAKAARKLACSKGMILSDEQIIMARRMSDEVKVFLPSCGIRLDSKN